MLVRMVVGLAGPAYALNPGDERDFPREEAIRLVQAGYAVPAAADDVERTIAPPAPEVRQAAVPGKPRRRRKG
jgi:hypothetical protein